MNKNISKQKIKIMNSRTKKQKHLIIGAGEVGRSLFNILRGNYEVVIRDIESAVSGKFNVLHVCYPPIKDFINITKKYIREYEPDIIIVHSTVPVGTTRKLGVGSVHSPVRGTHPNLEKGLKTFVKYFGGEKAKEAASIFSKIGVKTKILKNAEASELGKILDTTYYGWNIIFCNEVKKICDELGLDFDEVYTIPNKDYNEGYAKLGKTNVIRPVLKPSLGKIGGHCVVPNCDLLKSWPTEIIKKRNQKY